MDRKKIQHLHALKKMSILYVEDEVITQEYVAATLEQYVGELMTAGDGVEGLDVFRERRPDIVVADIRMPRMDGLSMIREIRAEDPEAAVIITTFLEDTPYLKQAIDLGVNGYAVKPLEPESLLRTLAGCAEVVLAARELKQQKRLNELMLDAMPYPALLYRRADGSILSANRKAVDLELCVGQRCQGPMFAGEGAPGLDNGGQEPVDLDEICAHERYWDRVAVAVNEEAALFMAVDVTAQHEMEIEREHYTSILRATIESAASAIAVFDRTGEVLAMNRNFQHMWRLPEDWRAFPNTDARMAYLRKLVKDPEVFEERTRHLMRNVEEKGYDIIELADGRLIERYALPYREGGRAVGKVSSCLDVTERVRMENELREAEATYRAIFENAVEGIFRSSTDGRFLQANQAMANLLGYETATELMESITDMGTQFYTDPERRDECLRTLEKSGAVANFDAEVMRKDGGRIWVSLFVRAVRDSRGNVKEYEGLAVDVTERMLRENELRRKASFDELTGLPNRRHLDMTLSQMMAQAKRAQRRFALLYVDLDRFKQVNDVYGHHVGDELLRQVAERIAVRFRRSDSVARLGGDEFVVLLWNIDGVEGVRTLSEDLIATISAPYELSGGIRAQIGASVGASIFPYDADDAPQMLKRADAAMYRAKKEGRNAFETYSPPEAYDQEA